MTSSHKMNAGVELLLKRMETHPEEFNGEARTKWLPLITAFRDHLDKEDIDALDAGIDKILQQQFTEKVLEGLVDPKPSSSLKELLSLKQQSGMPLGGLTLGAYSNTASATLSASGNLTTNSLTLGKTTLNESTVEHMIAHIEAIRKESNKQKEHKTLFGRLKNYLHNEPS